MSCPECATELAPGSRFCGECGAAIPDNLVDSRGRGAPTILGIDADAVKAAAAAAIAEAEKSASNAERAEASGKSGQSQQRLGQTMLGLSSETSPAQAFVSGSSAPDEQARATEWQGRSAPPRPLDRTQLEGEQNIEALEAVSQASASLPEPSFVRSRLAGNGKATSLGLGAPLAPLPSKGMGRTMLGVPLASLSPSPLPPGPDTAPVVTGTPVARTTASGGPTRPSLASSPALPAQPARLVTGTGTSETSVSRAVLTGLLVGLVLLGVIVLIYTRLTGQPQPANVRAQITSNEQGEALAFEVPGAQEGSRLRFGNQEQPLVNGRATFPLASDSLRVGDNIVLADVRHPSGETSSARIVLAVAYRLWVDTSGLRSANPSIDVKVAALPKTRVTLEGQDLALDSQGRGSKSFPLDTLRPGKGGVIDHIVHYRVQPPSGEAVIDELHTRIPMAMMQIDRPGQDLVTDSDTVEIEGAVGRDTEVSIDGKQVPVKGGHFVQRLALPKPGDYKPRVTASSEGKAPFSVTLSITRVRDLAQAAREFSYDKSLTYAKIAARPSSYRGQPIAIEGRVYAVDTRAGSSVIQMLARPCPASQRCSLWVVDPKASDVGVDRWVRVLGVVDGEQQFRSESDQIVTVPKVVARFILPAKP